LLFALAHRRLASLGLDLGQALPELVDLAASLIGGGQRLISGLRGGQRLLGRLVPRHLCLGQRILRHVASALRGHLGMHGLLQLYLELGRAALHLLALVQRAIELLG